MCVLTGVHWSYGLTANDRFLLTGSFGASAVLVFDAFDSALAQPQNVVFGHLVSAIVGVSVAKVFGSRMLWFSQSLAVALSITAMGLTNCMHPPGGATALLAVIGSPELRDLGYAFIVYPTLSGAVLIVACGIVTNNVIPTRSYPQYWCPSWLPKRLWRATPRAHETNEVDPCNSSSASTRNIPGAVALANVDIDRTLRLQSDDLVDIT